MRARDLRRLPQTEAPLSAPQFASGPLRRVATSLSAALQMLLDWCLDNSLKGDGFVVTGDGTPASIWYYAIRFLQFVGFWDGKAPWGWMKKTTNSPDPKTLGQALRSRFERDFDDNSPEAEKVKDILKAIAAGQPLPKLRPGVPIF